MSVVINQNPDSISPVYNEMDYLVNSDQTAQSNFKFVLDLYVEGQSNYRETKPALPSSTKAVFDVSGILKSYVTFDISKTDYGFTTNPNSYVAYTAKFGEQYGPTSAIAVTSGTTNDSMRYAFNGVFGFTDWKDYASTTYALSVPQRRYLTNFPSSGVVRSDEYRWLYMLNPTANKCYYAYIVTKDSSGATLDTFKIINASSGVTTSASRFIKFSSGGANMNLIPANNFLLGAQPIMTASVASYTIQMFDSTNAASSEQMKFVINDECSKYTSYPIYFLNALGGFDTHTFILADKKEVAINRTKYKQVVGSVSGNSYTYNKSDRQEIILNTTLRDKVLVNSTYLLESQVTWLEELITSPVVYVDDPTHGLVAINILSTTFEKKKRNTDKLINISFAFEYTYQRYRQQG